MNFTNILAIGTGAALGAWSRWGLGLVFNVVWPGFPLGTLAANLVGGLMMGMVMVLIGMGSLDSASLRLFVTTGFLGGLTTFSAFTGESLAMLHRQEYTLAMLHACSHVFGALLMAAIGVAFVEYIKQ